MSPWLAASWQSIVEGLHSKASPHAWCIVHPPGVPAGELSDHLVRVLLCQDPVNHEPCGDCVSCRMRDTHSDVLTLEPEGAAGMIKVDAVRDAIEVAYTTASMGGRRVVLVRPADCLNQASSNALLKIVEEPPSRTVFVFQTALPGKLLPTLVSRLRTIKVPTPSAELFAQAVQSLGITRQQVNLASALLAEPLAAQTNPDSLALANDVLQALVRIRGGADAQMVVKSFSKADTLVASTVMERVCEHLIRAHYDRVDNAVTEILTAPYPAVPLLFQFKERIAEVKKQAQAGIAVNAGLALGSLFAAWGFIWTRVQA